MNKFIGIYITYLSFVQNHTEVLLIFPKIVFPPVIPTTQNHEVYLVLWSRSRVVPPIEPSLIALVQTNRD